jgi:plastocyanin
MCLAAALAGMRRMNTHPGNGTATATASASGSEATSALASASTATITIASMNYGDPVTVPPGAQIAIKNNDSVEHSVTSDTAGKFTVDVDGNEQGTLSAPSEPGEYAFHCKYHPSMHGTLIVK